MFEKVYVFLSFSKNIGKSKKLLEHATKSGTYAPKTTSKKATQATAEATGDLTDKKTANKITKKSSQSNSKTSSETEEKSIEISKKGKYIQKNGIKLLMI